MKSVVKGFTLLELMVTLAVVAVTLGIGLPAFAPTVERVRVANTYHLLTASLMAARTAAVTRSVPVTVCPSSDGNRCRDDQVWEDGWIIFTDADRSGQPDTAASVLRRVEAINGDLSLRTTSGRQRVRYNATGQAYGSNLTLWLCGHGGEHLIGKVIVNNAGRARTQRTQRTPGHQPCTH